MELPIDTKAILDGTDRRSSVMLRNIPNKLTQTNILNLLDTKFRTKYDFFYMPVRWLFGFQVFQG